MPIDWNAQTFQDHYSIRIRWADLTDLPDAGKGYSGNVNGERIGERVSYGLDFARYAQRMPDGVGGQVPYAYYADRAWKIRRCIRGITAQADADRVILVGAEFGYTLNALLNADRHPAETGKYLNAWGIDNSSYIETNLGDNKIANEDEKIIFRDWTANNTKPVTDDLTSITGGTDFQIVVNGVTETFDLRGGEPDRTVFEALLDANVRGLSHLDTRLIINMVDTALGPDEDPYSWTGDGPNPQQTLVDYNTTLKTLADWSTERESQTWLDMRSGAFIPGVLT